LKGRFKVVIAAMAAEHIHAAFEACFSTDGQYIDVACVVQRAGRDLNSASDNVIIRFASQQRF
jgi:hypothetical protein